jgi:hypothetical protein
MFCTGSEQSRKRLFSRQARFPFSCSKTTADWRRVVADELQDSIDRANDAIELMAAKTRITELKTKLITGKPLTELELKELAELEARVAHHKK